MRFLSKYFILIILLIALISASFLIVFDNDCRLNYTSNITINSGSSFNKIKNEQFDDTIFNLRYNNKIWKFKAREFEIDSKVFTLNARINNLNRNGTREDKIKLINKLIKINISPEIAFNYIYFGFNNKLNKIEKNIQKLPKDAKISIKSNKLNIEKEIIGIKLNKYLFYNNLIKLFNNGEKIININIPVIETKPQVTSDMLQKYTNKRAEFSTSIATSSSGRKYNVRKALNAINGTRLGKREKFSFNARVGNRTTANGYKQAKVILDGEFVEGVGGGVCQVSSTLYNAVLLAGLKVTSSQKHSQRVSYVIAGFDAMVNYGTSDLVFENNTDGDIYILCNYTDSKISISIYGESMQDVSYKLVSEKTDIIPAGPAKTIYDTEGKYIDKVVYDDESFELKKARDGYTIKSYIIKCMKGVEVEKILLRTDKYLPQHSVTVYGANKRADILDAINIQNTLYIE